MPPAARPAVAAPLHRHIDARETRVHAAIRGIESFDGRVVLDTVSQDLLTWSLQVTALAVSRGSVPPRCTIMRPAPLGISV